MGRDVLRIWAIGLTIATLAALGRLALATPTFFSPLKSYRVDPHGVTTSGISSGAFMAVQMHVAHSSVISGAASIAGGIYGCAKGQPSRAQTVCMRTPDDIVVTEYFVETSRLAAAGEIDPVANLQNGRAFIFSSLKDETVNAVAGDKLAEFYARFKMTDIKIEKHDEAAHGFPTVDYGLPCGVARVPYLLKCNYDGAGEVLAQMYGPLAARGVFDPSHLFKFDQGEFGSPLYPYGWIYVPADCQVGLAGVNDLVDLPGMSGRDQTCRLHVALHGCKMNPDFIQDQFVTKAGYNEWAETNRIIVLYPQSQKVVGANPYGCWDWFGFTGPNYAVKSGAQISALKKMIDRVRGI